MERRSILKKSLDTTLEVMNTTRAMMTSMDLSAVLRQGGFIVLGHPVRGAKAFPEMFKALRSEKGQFAIEQSIMKRPNYQLYQDSGLFLSDHGHELQKMEEAYLSRWADKIPGVAASGRAYTTYLNVLRANSFDSMIKNLPMQAGKPSIEEAKAIANYINVATGRGSLGGKENALVALNAAFFAPRYVLSRFQLMGFQPIVKSWNTPVARNMVAKEYARFLTGLGSIYALSIAMGAKVGIDPHSSDYGKIILGNTRIDPMIGISQTSTFTTRILTNENSRNGYKLSLKGMEGGKSKEMNARDYGMVIQRFLRSKVSPIPGAYWNWRTGEDISGNKLKTVGDTNDIIQGKSVAGNMVTPLALKEIYSTMVEQGVPKGTALALLSIFGMGLQTYGKKAN